MTHLVESCLQHVDSINSIIFLPNPKGDEEPEVSQGKEKDEPERIEQPVVTIEWLQCGLKKCQMALSENRIPLNNPLVINFRMNMPICALQQTQVDIANLIYRIPNEKLQILSW